MAAPTLEKIREEVESLNIEIEKLDVKLLKFLYEFSGSSGTTLDILVAYPKLIDLSLKPRKLYKDDYLNLSDSESIYYQRKVNKLKEHFKDITNFIYKQLNKHYSAKQIKSMSNANKKEFLQGTKGQDDELKLKALIKLWVIHNEVLQNKEKTNQKDIINQYFNQLFANSELIGDVILLEATQKLIAGYRNMKPEYKDKKYDLCFQKLEILFNTNFFSKEIMDKLKFKIQDFLPLVKKLPIRTLKRKNQSRKEMIDDDCIDYKYTANLYEQLIFLFSFIFTPSRITSIFEYHLKLINFDIYKYIDQCYNNEKYLDIKFKTGCSCLDSKTNTKICDNPPPFTKTQSRIYNMETLPCPSECSQDAESILASIISQESTKEGKKEILEIISETI